LGISSSITLLIPRSQDIQTCQDSGKVVLLSLGGAIGDYGFSSSSQAQSFATTVWNLFGGGSSDTRPFGDSVVDGFDLGIPSDLRLLTLDIENNQPQFYSDFITALRGLFAGGSKQYYITGAPQYLFLFPFANLIDVLSLMLR
jgi:chitinase